MFYYFESSVVEHNSCPLWNQHCLQLVSLGKYIFSLYKANKKWECFLILKRALAKHYETIT